MNTENRIYYISDKIVVRDDPMLECPVLEYNKDTTPEEINAALNHCKMKIQSVWQRIQCLYMLRRITDEEGCDDSDDRSKEGDRDSV